jgi:hypothetical protein
MPPLAVVVFAREPPAAVDPPTEPLWLVPPLLSEQATIPTPTSNSAIQKFGFWPDGASFARIMIVKIA